MKIHQRIFNHLFRPLVYIVFKLYYNPKITNKPKLDKKKSYVLAGNHKHEFDPLLVQISYNRIINTLAKKDLFDGKFGLFFKLIGSIPVDFKKTKNKESLLKAIERLNKGYIVNVSPEAGINYSKAILMPFKKGGVIMAKETNNKIIPYAIKGEYKFRSENLEIRYGKEIDISNLAIDEANTILFKEIKRLLIEEE